MLADLDNAVWRARGGGHHETPKLRARLPETCLSWFNRSRLLGGAKSHRSGEYIVEPILESGFPSGLGMQTEELIIFQLRISCCVGVDRVGHVSRPWTSYTGYSNINDTGVEQICQPTEMGEHLYMGAIDHVPTN